MNEICHNIGSQFNVIHYFLFIHKVCKGEPVDAWTGGNYEIIALDMAINDNPAFGIIFCFGLIENYSDGGRS